MIKILKESEEYIKCIPSKYVLGASILSVQEFKDLLPMQYNYANELWWLRPDNNDGEYLYFVDEDGKINTLHTLFLGGSETGVRPVLILDMENSDLELYDVFEFGNHEFVIFEEGLAISYSTIEKKAIIGKCSFREDYSAEDACDYEKSDLKEYLNDWFEEAKKEADYRDAKIAEDDKIFLGPNNEWGDW